MTSQIPLNFKTLLVLWSLNLSLFSNKSLELINLTWMVVNGWISWLISWIRHWLMLIWQILQWDLLFNRMWIGTQLEWSWKKLWLMEIKLRLKSKLRFCCLFWLKKMLMKKSKKLMKVRLMWKIKRMKIMLKL